MPLTRRSTTLLRISKGMNPCEERVVPFPYCSFFPSLYGWRGDHRIIPPALLTFSLSLSLSLSPLSLYPSLSIPLSFYPSLSLSRLSFSLAPISSSREPQTRLACSSVLRRVSGGISCRREGGASAEGRKATFLNPRPHFEW